MFLQRFRFRRKSVDQQQQCRGHTEPLSEANLAVSGLMQEQPPTAPESASTSMCNSDEQCPTEEPTGCRCSPACDNKPPPGQSMLRAKLGNCVDTCLANMQGDARLQGISTTLDLMRLQMLVLGLASGAASMYDLRKSYIDGQRLKSMGITTEHLDAAVDVLSQSMQSMSISEDDQRIAMANIAAGLPLFQQAALPAALEQDADAEHDNTSNADDTAQEGVPNALPPSRPAARVGSTTTHTTTHTPPLVYASPYEDAVVTCLGGSKQVLTLAVNLFFRKVMADPLVAPFFRHYTPQQLRPKLVSFLAFSLGSNPQTIESLQAIHAPLVPQGLTMRHYDAVVEHFVATVQHLRVEPELVASARVNLTAMRVAFEDLLERMHAHPDDNYDTNQPGSDAEEDENSNNNNQD